MRTLPLFTLSLLLGCTTVQPNYQVFPLADGTFEVEATSADKDQAARDAAQGVTAHCKSEGKSPIFLDRPEPIYQGAFDETLVEGVRTAGRVARGVGAVEGDSDWDESLSSKDDYKAKFKASCR